MILTETVVAIKSLGWRKTTQLKLHHPRKPAKKKNRQKMDVLQQVRNGRRTNATGGVDINLKMNSEMQRESNNGTENTDSDLYYIYTKKIDY